MTQVYLSLGGRYNDYFVPKDDDYERPKTSHISDATKRALEELEFVRTWAEFVKICEKQKAKRGY